MACVVPSRSERSALRSQSLQKAIRKYVDSVCTCSTQTIDYKHTAAHSPVALQTPVKILNLSQSIPSYVRHHS